MDKKRENEIVLMDFSGVYEQQSFYEGEKTAWVEVRGLQGSNCYCDEEAVETIWAKIREFPAGGMHFIDSGNYHYMSRIWMEKIREPFRLLVFDNHTDMQAPAFGGILSCGGWIAAALGELPMLREVILAGPDEEAFGQTEPENRKRVWFLSQEALRKQGAARNAAFFRGIPTDLPLYISVDKDILCPEDACTGWSQGDVRLRELLEYLRAVKETFREKGGVLLGVDVCGELGTDQEGNGLVNDRANRAILEVFADWLWKE